MAAQNKGYPKNLHIWKKSNRNPKTCWSFPAQETPTIIRRPLWEALADAQVGDLLLSSSDEDLPAPRSHETRRGDGGDQMSKEVSLDSHKRPWRVISIPWTRTLFFFEATGNGRLFRKHCELQECWESACWKELPALTVTRPDRSQAIYKAVEITKAPRRGPNKTHQEALVHAFWLVTLLLRCLLGS